MKLELLSSAVAMALTSQAYALDPATSNAASTVKIYGTGASAQTATIKGIFEGLCAANTIDLYSGSAGSLSGVSCTIAAGVAGLAGNNVFLSYNNTGGSGNGVYPIAKSTNPGSAVLRTATNLRIAQMTTPSAANCTTTSTLTTLRTYTCVAAANATIYSDFGVSDVEPSMFKFTFNKPSAFALESLTDGDIGNLDKGSQNQVIMGVAANTALYTALLADQPGATVPSISKGAFAALLSGSLSTFDHLFASGISPGPAQFNLGKRVNGSGTQAAANAYFLGYGCTPSASLDPVAGTSVSGAPASTVVGVADGNGTGDVKTFLTARNTAGQYALGLISKENDPSADSAVQNGWAHIAIDGIVPGRNNFKVGKYDYGVEQSMQWNKNYLSATLRGAASPPANVPALPAGVTTTNLKDFLTAFRTAAGNPTVLDTLLATVQEGSAAIANDTYIYADTDPGTQGLANAKFVSRMTKNNNTCQPFQWNQ